MNNKRISRLVTPMVLGLALLSPIAIADNHSPQVLAETWVMTPKDGQAQNMQDALTQYRKDTADLENPREWRIYSPVLGEHLNQVAARSFGFSWSDMDSYQDWREKSNVQEKWNATVDQHVANYGHYMSVIDTKNSHWGPDVEYRFVGVTTYKVKPGHREALEEDKKTFSDAAKAQKWPFNWEWSDAISGSDTLMLAIPYQNWASMAPPQTKFTEVLAKHLGSEEQAKKMFERWSTHFESSHYSIYELREDI